MATLLGQWEMGKIYFSRLINGKTGLSLNTCKYLFPYIKFLTWRFLIILLRVLGVFLSILLIKIGI